MPEYDAARKSSVTLPEAQAAIGRRATLTLTGEIIDAGQSEAGTFVKFRLDPRWGFAPQDTFVMDFDPFILEDR